MEDAYAVFPNLCEVSLTPGNDAPADKLPLRIAAQMDAPEHGSLSSSPNTPTPNAKTKCLARSQLLAAAADCTGWSVDAATVQ